MTLILLFIFMLIALGLSALTFIYKRMTLSILSAFAWMLCAFLTSAQATLDITIRTSMMIFFMFCFLSMLVVAYQGSKHPQEKVVPANPHQYMIDLQAETDVYRKLRRRQY